MMPSLSLTVLLGVLIQVIQFTLSSAKTITLNWSITWATVAPDGFQRPVIGINGQWPCPPITADVGDRVIIHVSNSLGNETTSIHFHGLFQKGTNGMDGPTAVTQCPIPVGGNFVYDFSINQPGTYWYHAHNKGQYIDGFRGPIIVHDPAAPFSNEIDGDITITLSDWYRTQAPFLLNFFASKANEDAGGSEPIPDSTLISGVQQGAKFPVEPGKTYLVRIINMGAFTGQYFSIEEHDMTIVEVDGVYTDPVTVKQIYLTVAQRYGVLINTKKISSKGSRNYAVLATMDSAMFDHVPPDVDVNSYGFLVYNNSKPMLKPTPIAKFEPYDDFELEPWDRMELLRNVDQQITMNMEFKNLSNSNRAFINNVTYIPQKVPTLYTAISAPESDVMNPVIYGVNSNPFVLKFGQVVEIVLNNFDDGAHPWHMHGHNFQVVARSNANAAPFTGTVYNPPATPIRRDTIEVKAGGYLVIRFQSDNPDMSPFFLFLCCPGLFLVPRLSIHPSICPFVHLSVCSFIHPFIHPLGSLTAPAPTRKASCAA